MLTGVGVVLKLFGNTVVFKAFFENVVVPKGFGVIVLLKLLSSLVKLVFPKGFISVHPKSFFVTKV